MRDSSSNRRRRLPPSLAVALCHSYLDDYFSGRGRPARIFSEDDKLTHIETGCLLGEARLFEVIQII